MSSSQDETEIVLNGGTDMWRFTIAILGLVMMLGCGRESEKKGTPEVQKQASTAETSAVPNDVIEAYQTFMNDARTLFQLGETNRVISMMTDAYENNNFQGLHDNMYSDYVQTLLHAQKWDRALDVILNAKNVDPETHGGTGIMLIKALEWFNRHEDVLTLTEYLIPRVEEGSRTMATLYQRQVLARFRLDQFDIVLQNLPKYIDKLGWISNDIFLSFQLRLIQLKRLDHAETLLVEMGKLRPDEEWVTSFTAVSRVGLFKAREDWEGAATHFVAVSDFVKPGDLKLSFIRLVAKLYGIDRQDVVESMCKRLTEADAGKTALGADAGREWVAIATKRQDWGTALARLQWLLDTHPGDPAVQDAYEKSVYGALESGDEKLKKSFVAIGERMLDQPLSTDERNRVRQNLFNVAFLLEDYDEVIAILEKRLPQFEESWHDMALNKALAHKALKAGNKREAADRFKAFMDDTATEFTNPEIDPTTGMIYSKEMILGRNARRIGDLLTDIGDKQEARELYKQAIAHYESALNRLTQGSGEFEFVMDELGKIPD